jgi:nitroimidazol reductase NimA-like FMN-containing flavoprotein (pyridoxamine 5'-phosphate oxidase superfamily)
MTTGFRKLMLTKAHGKLPQGDVWGRIVTLLKGQTMCTLCTCSGDVPRATPLEYYLDGTALYMIGHQGVKLSNIRANPKVSVGVYNHVHPRWGDGGNWLGVLGAQITGTARLIPDSEPEYAAAYPKFASPTSRPLVPGEPPKGRLMLVIEMQRVEYMDIALKLDGFASKQVWEVTPE